MISEKLPQENYEILREWEEDGYKMRSVKVLATPEAKNDKPVFIEMTEREINPGDWQKVDGSEKFLEEAA